MLPQNTDPQTTSSELVEKSTNNNPRRHRRTANQLLPVSRQQMPGEFDVRGPGSDAEIARTYETQRMDVMSVIVHDVRREVRELRAMLLRGVDRKGIQSERGIDGMRRRA